MPNFLQVVGHIEISKDFVNVSPIKSQGNKRKPMSKAKRERQMIASTLQWSECHDPYDDCYVFITFVTEEVMVKMPVVFLSKDVFCDYDNRLHKWERKPQYFIHYNKYGLRSHFFRPHLKSVAYKYQRPRLCWGGLRSYLLATPLMPCL